MGLKNKIGLAPQLQPMASSAGESQDGTALSSTRGRPPPTRGCEFRFYGDPAGDELLSPEEKELGRTLESKGGGV